MNNDEPFVPILKAEMTCPICGNIETIDIPPDY
jgi:hypothetical protein